MSYLDQIERLWNVTDNQKSDLGINVRYENIIWMGPLIHVLLGWNVFLTNRNLGSRIKRGKTDKIVLIETGYY